MTREELNQLREDFLCHNSEQLKDIYLQNRDKIIDLLRIKMNVGCEQAEDVFTDALLVFRQNVISGKIKTLSSVRAYLSSTCVNMVRENWNFRKRKLKKEEAVRLLLYEKNYNDREDSSAQAEMIEQSQKAFAMLSDKCQRILIAFYVYKIPMKEIAEELGFSTADVAKMTKSRCLKTWIRNLKSIKD